MVFEHVLTISLRTNERASDLSREIYGFIHRERAVPSLSSDPSSILALLEIRFFSTENLRSEEAQSPFPATSHSHELPHVRSDVESPLASRRILTAWSAAGSAAPWRTYSRNPPFNRDLPECLRKEAVRGFRFAVSRGSTEVNLIAATYRGCGSEWPLKRYFRLRNVATIPNILYTIILYMEEFKKWFIFFNGLYFYNIHIIYRYI